MAVPFKTYANALRSLPRFIGGLDPFQHKTIGDLRFRVRHELDLYVEGEDNEIQCRRQSDTTKRVQACRAFIARCDASDADEAYTA